MGFDATTVNDGARLKIFNLNTNENITVQFNPTEFTENLEVNYGRPTVLGQSHQTLQYLNTSNFAVPMELFFLSRDQDTHAKGMDSKAFLYSLCYAPNQADSIVSGAPPRAFIVWPPNVLTLTCKITRLTIRNQRFNRDGEVVQYTANCVFEEMRDVRWTSQDARRRGANRSDDNPGDGA